MSTGRTIAKNAIWITIYPIVLGIISLFVAGYISQILGKADYGKLVFSLSFINTFSLISTFGIRSVFVRALAADTRHITSIIGKTLVLRLLLTVIAFVLAIITLHLLNYPRATKILVYIAAISLFFSTIKTTFQDTFQAMERMHYIALVNILAGVLIIAMSLLALKLGFRVIGVSVAYMLGALISAITAIIILTRKFCKPKLEINFVFWKQILSKAMYFFCAAILSTIGINLGIILLSKLAGDNADSAIGLFGAAKNLTQRILIIADGICTAVFPAMVIRYRTSPENAATLFRKTLLYLVLLSFPISVGMIIVAEPILLLLNGSEYIAALPTLKIGAIWMVVKFPCVLMCFTLGAIRQEKELAGIFAFILPSFLAISAFLIPSMHEKGVMIALLCSEILAFVILSFYTRRHLEHRIFLKLLPMIKIIASTIIMGIVVYLLRHHHLVKSISAGVVTYAICTLAFKTVAIEDLKTFFKKAKS